MALDMRALYYIHLAVPVIESDSVHDDDVKANENCLNQNFNILSQAIYELTQRVQALETTQGG